MSHRVAIVHPWFPAYREAFFRDLIRSASTEGISIDVFHGEAPREWRARGDAINRHFAKALKTRSLAFREKSLIYKSLAPLGDLRQYDLIILEHALRNLETWKLFLDPRTRKSLAFCGHGGSYTSKPRGLRGLLKRILLLRAVWFFAYTEGGARAVEKAGFESSRITVVRNSIDTSRLSSDLSGVTSHEVSNFRGDLRLEGPTAIFVGGIDSSKRIPLLLDACEEVASQIPHFALLVAGDGADRSVVESRLESAPWLRYLGQLQGRKKALALLSADIIAMPGRVGLVAVDSFVSGRPIVTTEWPFHAPEFEYLTDGVNAIVAKNDQSSFAAAVQELLSRPATLDILREGCYRSSRDVTLESMVDNFLRGITGSLEVGVLDE